MRRISFMNVWMENVSNPIIIDQYYCDSPFPCPNQVSVEYFKSDTFLKNLTRITTNISVTMWKFDMQTSGIHIHSVSFIGIRGTSATKNAIKFACSDSSPCKKLFLKDVQLVSYSGLPTASFCWKAYGSTSGLNNPPSCFNFVEQTTKNLSNWSDQFIWIILDNNLIINLIKA